MRHEQGGVGEKLRNGTPMPDERRLRSHIAPGDPVDVGEEEGPSRRPDQDRELVNDLSPCHFDHGQGARTVPAIIRGLEIKRHEAAVGMARIKMSREFPDKNRFLFARHVISIGKAPSFGNRVSDPL